MSLAVWPFLLRTFSKRRESLEASNSNLTTSLWWFWADLCSAVLPSLSWWNMSAPFLSKSWTILWWPNQNKIHFTSNQIWNCASHVKAVYLLFSKCIFLPIIAALHNGLTLPDRVQAFTLAPARNNCSQMLKWPLLDA